MKKFILPLILFILVPLHSQAANADLTTLRKFTESLRVGPYPEAEKYVSNDSKPLFQRYVSHDLGHLTPQNYSINNRGSQNGFRKYQIISRENSEGQPRATNIVFITENNQPKIDLPETLRLGFGQNWEQRINVIEQGYTFAKMQFGEAESQRVLESLLNKNRQ